MISREELIEAISASSVCWSVPDIDVGRLLAAADLYQYGGLSFTEFVAACLYSQYRPVHTLAETAFIALDSDRDGLIRMNEVKGLCRDSDMRLLSSLPQDRPFNVDEWCRCIVSSCRRTRTDVPHLEEVPMCGSDLQALGVCEAPQRATTEACGQRSSASAIVEYVTRLFGCSSPTAATALPDEADDTESGTYAKIYRHDPSQEERDLDGYEGGSGGEQAQYQEGEEAQYQEGEEEGSTDVSGTTAARATEVEAGSGYGAPAGSGEGEDGSGNDDAAARAEDDYAAPAEGGYGAPPAVRAEEEYGAPGSRAQSSYNGFPFENVEAGGPQGDGGYGGCPGGSIEACVGVCPGSSTRVYGACVRGCDSRCPE